MTDVATLLAKSKPLRVVFYFDKITIRTGAVPQRALSFLRKNATSADVHRGRDCAAYAGYPWLLTVVNPNKAALRRLAGLRGVATHVEVALDEVVASDIAAAARQDLFDGHFVVRRHRTMRSKRYPSGRGASSRAKPEPGERSDGHYFIWYSDKPSKPGGEPFCLHMEARYQGVEAVRRFGIHDPRDLLNLLTFDHETFWHRHLTLYSLDRERLGRWHRNQLSGGRSKRGIVDRYPTKNGTLIYNHDARLGGTLYQIYSRHREEGNRSIQQFVDSYGIRNGALKPGLRGPYLRRLVYSTVHIPHCVSSPEAPAIGSLLVTSAPESASLIESMPKTVPSRRIRSRI
jgi:hypothetical protein